MSMDVSEELLSAFEAATEEWKLSMCQQVDSLFASFRETITGASGKGTNGKASKSQVASSAADSKGKATTKTSVGGQLRPMPGSSVPLLINGQILNGKVSEVAQNGTILNIRVNLASNGPVSSHRAAMSSVSFSSSSASSSPAASPKPKGAYPSPYFTTGKKRDSKGSLIYRHSPKASSSRSTNGACTKDANCTCEQCSSSMELPEEMLQVEIDEDQQSENGGGGKRSKGQSSDEYTRNLLVAAAMASFKRQQQGLPPEGEDEDDFGEDEEDWEDGQMFPCLVESCGKLFDSAYKLTQHNRNQHNKRYHCPVRGCSKSFHNGFMLKVHQNLHMGIRPYRCKWPDCTYGAGQRSDVIKHIRSVHFNLPSSLRKQQEAGIEDTRDPTEYLEILSELLN